MKKITMKTVKTQLSEKFKQPENPVPSLTKGRNIGVKATKGKEPKKATFTKTAGKSQDVKGKFSGTKKATLHGKPSAGEKFKAPSHKSYDHGKQGVAINKVTEPTMVKGYEGAASGELTKVTPPRDYRKIVDTEKSELIGSFLKGMNPKSKEMITFKAKAVQGVKELSYDPPQLTKGAKIYSPASAPKKTVTESVVDGTVVINIGSKRMVFEAANVKRLRSFIKNLTEVRQKVSINVVSGMRKSYDDPKLYESLLTYHHYKRSGLNELANEVLAEGYAHYRKLVASEHNEFIYETRKEWLEEAVRPSFKQTVKAFGDLYEGMCNTHMVIVNTSNRGKNERYKVMTKALTETHAAAHAIDEILEEAGPTMTISSAYVESTKINISETKSPSVFKPLWIETPHDLKKAKLGVKNTKGKDVKPATFTKMPAPSAGKSVGGSTVMKSLNKGGDAKKFVKPKGGEPAGKGKPMERAKVNPKM